VGLDTLGHVARNSFELVDDENEKQDFILPDFFDQMIAKKMLGKKTQGGFYKTELTPEWKKIRKVLNPASMEYEDWRKADFPCLAAAKQAKSLPEKLRAIVYGDDKGAVFAWKAVADQLIYSANRIPEISDTVVEIDNAMKWGYNFEMGPFETWDAIGVQESVLKMEADGLAVPKNVTQMLAAGVERFYKTEDGRRFFYDFDAKAYKEIAVSASNISLAALKGAGGLVKRCASASLVDLGDGVFCCEFHTKMNALNAEIIQFLNESMDYVEENGVGLVIGNQAGGMPGAFSAGADLVQVGTAARENRLAEVDEMIKSLHTVVQRETYSPFPVVAAPYGLALGGGCEVCLAADRIVAHAELYMGLVEIGVGLLPAGGGCKNLWKRAVGSIPANVTDVDLAKFFVPCFMNVAMAKVSTSAAEARANGFLGPTDRIVFNRDHLIGEAKKDVLAMCDSGYAPPVKRKLKVFGESAQGMINGELHNMRSAGFVSDHDVFLIKRIAYVMGGGDVRANSDIEEDTIIRLEREAFMDLVKEAKTQARIDHTLQTGKPLRN
jgi:3-hydroxyacyl-CoA dehydrogenase